MFEKLLSDGNATEGLFILYILKVENHFTTPGINGRVVIRACDETPDMDRIDLPKV